MLDNTEQIMLDRMMILTNNKIESNVKEFNFWLCESWRDVLLMNMKNS